MIRFTLYTLAFVVGFTLALAGLLVALLLWVAGVRFDNNQTCNHE